MFDEKAIEKIKGCHYKLLEIKRKRRGHGLLLTNAAPYNEHLLEAEHPISRLLFPPHDIIEVYGVLDNKEYLLFTIDWSKDNAHKIKEVVNKLNKEIGA